MRYVGYAIIMAGSLVATPAIAGDESVKCYQFAKMEMGKDLAAYEKDVKHQQAVELCRGAKSLAPFDCYLIAKIEMAKDFSDQFTKVIAAVNLCRNQ